MTVAPAWPARPSASSSDPVAVEDYIGVAANVPAAVQSAITAATAAGTQPGVVGFKPGKAYTFAGGAPPKIPRNLPAPGLVVDLAGAKITLTASCPRVFDFDRTADHQLFANWEIRGGGATIDADNQPDGSSSSHVLVGTIAGSSTQLRVNVDNFTISDIDVINVPYDPTGTVLRKGVGLEIRHAGSGEGTQNYLTRGKLDNVRVYGGNHGFRLIGQVAGGATTGNILVDDILIRDCEHDSGRTPLAADPLSTDVNVQVGGYGIGGACTITRFKGKGSNDVGVETNGMTTTLVDDCDITDARNDQYFVRHFNTALHQSVSRTTYRDCRAWVLNLNPTPTTFTARGWGIGITAASADPAPVKGVYVQRCRYYSAQTSAPMRGQALAVDGQCELLDIDDLLVVFDAVNDTLPANVSGSAVWIDPLANKALVFRPHKIRVEVSGTIALNAHTYDFTALRIMGQTSADITLDGERSVRLVSSLAGVAAGSTYTVQIGPSSAPGAPLPKVRGTLGGVAGKVTGGDTDPWGIAMQVSTNFTPDKELRFRDADFSQYPTGGTARGAGNQARYVYMPDQAIQRAVVAPGLKIPGNYKQSAQARTFTPAASNNYANVGAIRQLVVMTAVAGTALTKVEYVRYPSGVAHDTHNLTGPWMVDPGDQITFTGAADTAPTIQIIDMVA